MEKSSKAKLQLLLRSVGFLSAVGVSFNFGWQAWMAGHRTVGSLGALVGASYALLLFNVGSRSTDTHSFFRLFPSLLYGFLLVVGMSFDYQPEVPRYQEVHSEKGWRDESFTIHGVSPGMSQQQVETRLGVPTGRTWDTHKKIHNLSASQCNDLVSLLEEDSAATFVPGKELTLTEYRKRLNSRYPNEKYPKASTWDGRPAGRADFKKLFSLGNCVVTTVQPEEASAQLDQAIQNQIDSDAELLHLFRLENPEGRPWGSEQPNGDAWVLKRYPLLTFKQEGVALDYVEGKDEVDSVHGDQLVYGSKVVLSVGDGLDTLPPDWPQPRYREDRVYRARSELLDKVTRVADLEISNNRIQAHLEDGKVTRIAIFHRHYGN